MFFKSVGNGQLPFTTVANSLRLDGVADYLTRTPGATTNNKKYTISVWVRPAKLQASAAPIAAGVVSGSFYSELAFNASGQLDFNSMNGAGTTIGRRVTSRVCRDFGNYYHAILVVDTTAAVAADRIKVYFGNIQETSFNTSVDFSLNDPTGFNNNTAQYIGRRTTGGSFLCANIANFCMVDGLALTPSDFGYVDANGKWRSRSKAELIALVNAGGANSTFLAFDDGTNATTLCQDASGKGTNWTGVSILRDGSVSDNWSYDSPTNIYNLHDINRTPMSSISVTFLETNTGYDSSGVSGGNAGCNIAPSSGKWYSEFTATTIGSNAEIIVYPYGLGCAVGYRINGTKDVDNLGANSAYGAAWTTGDIIGIAMDLDAKQVTFYKNNVSQGAVTYTVTSVAMNVGGQQRGAGQLAGYFNFGQRPVSGGAWSSSAGGFFRYTPPTGYKAISQPNMEAYVATKDKFPANSRAVAVLDSGANIKAAAEAVFPSALYIIKDRDNTNNWQIVDNVRGYSAVLAMVSSSLETTYTTPAGNSVAHVFKTNGAAVANTDGSIASQVSANQDNGVSVVTYTGTGVNGTVGHGLGVAPKVVMVRDRASGTVSWNMHHTSLTSAAYYIQPGSTNAQTNDATMWNSTAPTSSVFSVGTHVGSNRSGGSYVAYCFAEVPNFSRFGSYLGGAALADLIEYPLDFKPGLLILKRIDAATYNWLVFDDKRLGFNVDNNALKWDNTASESPTDYILRLSEGFRVINLAAESGVTGGTYIFMAFAEKPIPYADAE